MHSCGEPCDLTRYIQAQEDVYSNVISELKSGRKTTHWMWFIFPQFDGLGRSPTAKFYAIKSLEEAQQYLQHPVLGARLLECSRILLAIKNLSIPDIFGFPDDLKLRSSMTLFAHVAEPGSVFEKVLDKYFEGAPDTRTLELIGNIADPTDLD